VRVQCHAKNVTVCESIKLQTYSLNNLYTMIVDMALTTVSDVRKVPMHILDETASQEYRADQQVAITVDPTLEESNILKVVGDECARPILLSIIDEPKSAIDITREKKIPISSVYRKIHWLENARLIRIKGFVITGDGKKYHLYQSRVKAIRISLPTNEIQLEFANNGARKDNRTVREQEIPIE